MNRSIHILLSVFIVLILVKVLFSNGDTEYAIERLLESKSIDHSMAEVVKETLGVYVMKTKYKDKWNVNKPIEKDHINIYLFNSEIADKHIPKELPKNLIGNCAYIGSPQLITCDTSLFNSFVRSIEEATIGDANAAYRPLIDKNIISWVIGHEIGHLIKGHKAAHFKVNSLDAIVSAASISQSQEYEADMYMANVLINYPELRDDMIHYLVYILRLYCKKKQGIRIVGPGLPMAADVPISLDRSLSHPEFIIRSYRLLILLKAEELYPELKEDLFNLQKLFSITMP